MKIISLKKWLCVAGFATFCTFNLAEAYPTYTLSVSCSPYYYRENQKLYYSLYDFTVNQYAPDATAITTNFRQLTESKGLNSQNQEISLGPCLYVDVRAEQDCINDKDMKYRTWRFLPPGNNPKSPDYVGPKVVKSPDYDKDILNRDFPDVLIIHDLETKKDYKIGLSFSISGYNIDTKGCNQGISLMYDNEDWYFKYDKNKPQEVIIRGANNNRYIIKLTLGSTPEPKSGPRKEDYFLCLKPNPTTSDIEITIFDRTRGAYTGGNMAGHMPPGWKSLW